MFQLICISQDQSHGQRSTKKTGGPWTVGVPDGNFALLVLCFACSIFLSERTSPALCAVREAVSEGPLQVPTHRAWWDFAFQFHVVYKAVLVWVSPSPAPVPLLRRRLPL